jgi:hypothetical protein
LWLGIFTTRGLIVFGSNKIKLEPFLLPGVLQEAAVPKAVVLVDLEVMADNDLMKRMAPLLIVIVDSPTSFCLVVPWL